MAEALQVHVFGGAIGECIILGLPGDRWDIIDVYLAHTTNPDADPVIGFLKKKGITQLEFLCLTHPHTDHVKGASYFLKHYQIRRCLGFGSWTPEQSYNQIVKVLKTKARRLRDSVQAEEIASELLDTLEAVNEKVRRGHMVSDPVLVNSLVVDETIGTDKLQLRIMAIAPSGRSVDAYRRQLRACFDTTRPGRILADRVNGVHHNEIWSAFIVEYGSQRIVLAGDVESQGWLDILNRPPPGFDLCADLVKVSHHGSESGYCPGLWENHLSPQQGATAVVTAFSPNGLPRPQASHTSERTANAW